MVERTIVRSSVIMCGNILVGKNFSRGKIQSLCQKFCHHPAQIDREKFSRGKFQSLAQKLSHFSPTFFPDKVFSAFFRLLVFKANHRYVHIQAIATFDQNTYYWLFDGLRVHRNTEFPKRPKRILERRKYQPRSLEYCSKRCHGQRF